MIGEVRRAVRADVDEAAAVLADAFADYAWTRWTIDGEGHADRVEQLQRLFMDRVALDHGEVWLAFDERGTLQSVAVWTRSDADVPASTLAEMSASRATLEGARHAASLEADAHIAHLLPPTPHYFLGACGTRRASQRRGFGRAVLGPVLDRARHEGEAAFLETSAAENVAFYSTLGFVVSGETEIPDGGPRVWAMISSR